MAKKLKYFFLFISVLIFVSSPSFADPYKNLSEYKFFDDLKNQIPSKDTIPYRIANPLFSDYSYKFRFVHFPNNKFANYNFDTVFDFPVGSTIIKTFAYPIDERNLEKGFKLLETRLLIKKENGWVPLSYIWDKKNEDAKIKYTGHTFNLSWINKVGLERSLRYRAPNINQCKTCHEVNDKIKPIGPKGRNMNVIFDYSEGKFNQIKYWENKGLLKNIPNNINSNPAIWDNENYHINDRARSYLDANCAHCHRVGGSASNSGFYLDLKEKDPVTLGILKIPVAAGRGSGGLKYIINPGKAEESILLYRMDSIDPGVMMPELSRNVKHAEAIPIIEDWINQLD